MEKSPPKPKQIELSEAEKQAMKESHKFALALTAPRLAQQKEATKIAQSISIINSFFI